MHIDALLASPGPYLAALWSRIQGKRLRAQARLAPLLAKSPNAYRLWLLSKDRSGTPWPDRAEVPPIVALVDLRWGTAGLDKTLGNLAAHRIVSLLIGTEDIRTAPDAARRIDWESAPLLMTMRAGDQIAPEAIQAYFVAISGKDSKLVYADDDLIDENGARRSPHFKPDWNAELFCHFDYVTGACVMRVTRDELEGSGVGEDWAQNLSRRLTAAERPIHLHRILHHRSGRPAPKMIAAPDPGMCEWPTVSIIIPTRNRVDLLKSCLTSLAQTEYPSLETIIVDNESDEAQTLDYLAGLDPSRFKLIRHEGEFNFSAINNRAVAQARGEFLCLLNNDVEVIEPGWLQAMVRQAMRPEVGAVGAQLLYPDGRIQHAGVVLGIGGAASHAHRLLRPDEEGYFLRHALPQFVSAVTAACLVVSKERFLDVGGLDEENFPVAFNDVDLCMKLNRRGWQTLYEPRAALIHHESVSRGQDRDPAGSARLAREVGALRRLWATDRNLDPFHHSELSRSSEHFVVQL